MVRGINKMRYALHLGKYISEDIYLAVRGVCVWIFVCLLFLMLKFPNAIGPLGFTRYLMQKD